MNVTERIMDARHTTEGKAVAVALTTLLAFSSFSPVSLAFADTGDESSSEPTVERAVVGEPQNEERSLAVAADHAEVFVDGVVVTESVVVSGDADLSFAVRALEGYEIESVSYAGTLLEPAGTQRSIATEGGEAGEESTLTLYEVSAELLEQEGALEVVAAPLQNEAPATVESEEAGSVSSSEEDTEPAPTVSSNLGSAVQEAVVESVTAVVDNTVDAVQPLIVQVNDPNTISVAADLYQGSVKLASRSLVLTADGSVNETSRAVPVSDGVFNFGSDRYVLNGKVAVVAAGATEQDMQAACERVADSAQNTTRLRVVEGTVEYALGASEEWTKLADGEQLVYFCSKLQNDVEDRGTLNVAVEEPVVDEGTEGAKHLVVMAFVGKQVSLGVTDPLFVKHLYFDGATDVLTGGMRFDLGDGVTYEVSSAYLQASALTAEQAAELCHSGAALAYESGSPIAWQEADTCTVILSLTARSYTVQYDINGGTGCVPAPATYETGEQAALVTTAPQGDLAKEGYRFAGWTMLDGAGNVLGTYQPGETFPMPSHDVILRAEWIEYDGRPFYNLRFVWNDTSMGIDHELKTMTVDSQKDAEGADADLVLGSEIVIDTEECPVGYHVARPDQSFRFDRVGQTITVLCEKNAYDVTVLYCYNGVPLDSDMRIAQGAPFDTPIELGNVAESVDKVFFEGEEAKHFLLESIEPSDFRVSADPTRNVISINYVSDNLGTTDGKPGDGIPDKYQAVVTFTHDEHSQWADGSQDAEKSAVVTLYKDGELATGAEGGVGFLAADQIPELIVDEGWVLDRTGNWPTTATPIVGTTQCHASYVNGEYGYVVQWATDEGTVLEEEAGVLGFEKNIPYQAKSFEGLALESISNPDGLISADESQNIVVLRYSTDVLGAEGIGDGVPDKYQAAVTYTVKNGAWSEDAADTVRNVVVTLNDADNEWKPLEAPDFQLPVASPRYGYNAQGQWDVVPSVQAIKSGVTAFEYACSPIDFPYTIRYYLESAEGEPFATASGMAPFEGAVPLNLEKYRPVRGYDLEPTLIGSAVMSDGTNEVSVVFHRESFTVQASIDDHGALEGESFQTITYAANSRPIVFTAEEGYRIASIVLNGESLKVANGLTSYEFQVKRMTKNAIIEVKTARMDEVVIEAPSLTKVYDGAPLNAASAVVTGAPEGLTVLAETTGVQAQAGASVTAVDKASIKVVDASGNDVTKNCQIKTIDGTLTVEKAPVTITVNDAKKTVGTSDPEFTGVVAGLVGGDQLEGVSYSRILKSERVGVYLDTITADYRYNPNYDVKVVPGTFTIGNALLVPSLDGPSMTPTEPNDGAANGQVRMSPLEAAQALLNEALVVAGTADLPEPVYAEVIDDDETPMVSRVGAQTIEDDENPLGAFDEPHCWVHWVMALGILLTLGYAGMVVANRLGYARRVRDLDDDLTSGEVADEARVAQTIRHTA